jgi:imidazolonepropionase
MMKNCSLLIRNAAEVVTPGAANSAAGGDEILLRIDGGAVAVEGERIVAVGPLDEIEREWKASTVLDAGGGAVTPSLCDPHTHLLFAGWRGAEFAARVSGRPVAGSGLSRGISHTVRETTSSSDESLEKILARRLDLWLLSGVTLVEIKSGYGLTVESELRMLEIIRRVAIGHSVEVVSTVLAAHSVPDSYRGRARQYLEEVAWPVTQMARQRGLAEYADVFIEEGAFTVEEAEGYLGRAREIGLGLRVHADQLSRGGGAALAARLGAASVDHLEQAGPPEVAALAGCETVAVLLPGAVLTVEGRGGARPPARSLIDAGVAVALATDFNPGTSTQPAPSLSMGLGCRLLGLTPDEALIAVTRNAVKSLGRESETGSLAVGKRADLCVWPFPCAADLGYQLAAHRPDHVISRGGIVVRDGIRVG